MSLQKVHILSEFRSLYNLHLALLLLKRPRIKTSYFLLELGRVVYVLLEKTQLYGFYTTVRVLHNCMGFTQLYGFFPKQLNTCNNDL